MEDGKIYKRIIDSCNRIQATNHGDFIFKVHIGYLCSLVNTKYDNLLLIYYSGTSNSKRVSEWIAETASEAGMKTHVTSY